MVAGFPPGPLLEATEANPVAAVDRPAPTGPARTLILAAAITGLAEIALQRVAAPLSGHPVLFDLGNVTQGATASLAALAATVWGMALWRRHRPAALTLAVATAAVLLAGAISPAAVQWAGVAGVIAVLVLWLPANSSWNRVALLAAGTAILAGIWPLLTVSNGIEWVSSTTALTIAEVGLLIVPIALAIGLVRVAPPRSSSWTASVVTGLGAAVVVVTAGNYAAMTTHLALGVSLSLAPALYVVSAASIGLLITEWLAAGFTRPLAAAFVLLAVAGTAPAAVHHTLAALIGLMLLATVLPVADDPSLDPHARRALTTKET